MLPRLVGLATKNSQFRFVMQAPHGGTVTSMLVYRGTGTLILIKHNVGQALPERWMCLSVVLSLIELLNYIWNKVHTVRQQIAACTVCSLKGTNNEIKMQSVIDKDAQGVSAREIYRQNVEKYMNDASQHFLGA